VTVITCVPNVPDGMVYPGYKNRLRRQVEQLDGIRVIRVWTYLAANAGTIRRILNYLSYMWVAVWTALTMPRPHVVVATSPQFFCGWAGVLVSKLKRVPLVLEIRDIWPESIVTVGAMRRGLLVRFLEWSERRMYGSADHIVAVGDGYRDNILEKVPTATEKATVITNGVDLDTFAPQPPDLRFLHQWDLEDRFVCSYIGTIGMAHGLEVVVEAARLLREKGRRDIVFCFVGDGASRKQLEERVASEDLQELVVFTGRQPKGEIPCILASSNACLIHLKKCELFGTVIPSKIFETMAMRRPIVMGVRGEANAIVAEAHASIDMEPDCPNSLVQAVEVLADNPELANKLGSAGREYVRQYYDRNVLAASYLSVLHRVAGVEEPSVEESKGPRVEDPWSEGIADLRSPIADEG